MDKKTLNTMIPILAVVIFFIWGWIDTFQHSWLIFVIAGGAMAVISAISNSKDKNKNESDTAGKKRVSGCRTNKLQACKKRRTETS